MVKEGLRNVAAGTNPINLKRGIDKAANYLLDKISDRSRPVNYSKAIAQVGAISAGNDELLARGISTSCNCLPDSQND